MTVFNAEQPTYERFRSIYAERTKNLVLWVGSGLSTPANLPTWSQLRTRLEREALLKTNTISSSASASDALRRKYSKIKRTSGSFLAKP